MVDKKGGGEGRGGGRLGDPFLKMKIMLAFPISTAVVCVTLMELLGAVVRNKWASFDEVLGWMIIKCTSGEVSGGGRRERDG